MTRQAKVLSIGLFMALLVGSLAYGQTQGNSEAPKHVESDEETRAPDVVKGRAIAVRDCGGCHAPEEEGQSLVEGAPTLREFAARWPVEYLAESLAEGIVSGHPLMPDYQYTPEQIGDLLAYLDLIGKGQGGTSE